MHAFFLKTPRRVTSLTVHLSRDNLLVKGGHCVGDWHYFNEVETVISPEHGSETVLLWWGFSKSHVRSKSFLAVVNF